MNNATLTPLRYPGGKSIFTNFFEAYIYANNIINPIYIEPYCGGAGAAINLLLSNRVDEIYLNDANYSIYAFWYSLKKYGDDFLEKLYNTEINLRQWKIQREVFNSLSGKTQKKADILANGFATFYLNRSNRSGILNAGPVGGQSKEKQISATYKINARFNKSTLIEKLQAIINKKNSINIFNKDAINFLTNLSERYTSEFQKRCFVYLDPPYYLQGSSLYLNYYNNDDHAAIADFLSIERDWCWLLSYDNVDAIRMLYNDFDIYSFYLNYSAHQTKLGNELLIHSNNSILPSSLLIKEIKKTKKRVELVLIN